MTVDTRKTRVLHWRVFACELVLTFETSPLHMDAIFHQLGHLFFQTIPTVVLVFGLFIFLDRMFFRPIKAILKQRDEATAGALARAREQAASAEQKAREYEEKFQAARQEVYRQRESARRSNLEQRDGVLHNARAQAEVLIRDARASLAAEIDRSKVELDRSCQSLAEEISHSLIEADTTPGGQGRLRF